MVIHYFCPLYNREIDEGKCLDINYELIRAKKKEELKMLQKFLKKDVKEIEKTCISCENYPFDK
ncbi:hypothetical protein FLK61_31475 [Paenalkalicoccus suaedae]|uniref:Uncharacterized protein n=1 Tax=Paenalkalicoccus suaedae TaxID=2592382 RepID=A0A859FD01_9BACI|nr:hypothetical protein [Paenalkalicoccus suaedae]QKS71233.1 hypothetical protein FLK61_31475 [Paenalkalicoccus suaedae]